MGKYCVHFSNRPAITISALSSRQISRCYSEGTYKIVSSSRLSSEKISALWNGGFLGAGQEWGIKSQCDGKESPAGFDTLDAFMVDDNGKVLDEPAVNFFGDPVKPVERPYYEYVTYYRVDSGD